MTVSGEFENLRMSVRNRLGRLLHQFRRYHQASIPGVKFEHLKTCDIFVDVLQITRFLSSIRSAQRIYLGIPNDGRPENNKDRFEQVIRQAAVLYQTLEKLNQLKPRLEKLSSWLKNKAVSEQLLQELSDTQSYLNRVIKPIRNKVAYHFDRSVITDTVAHMRPAPEYLFAVAAREINRDMVYPIVDQAILDYITRLIGAAGMPTDAENYQVFLEYVLSRTKLVATLAAAVIEEFVLGIGTTYTKKRIGGSLE